MVKGGHGLAPEREDLAPGCLHGPGGPGILPRGPPVHLGGRGGPEVKQGAGVLLDLVDGIRPGGDGHGLGRLGRPPRRDLILQDAQEVLLEVHHVHGRQGAVPRLDQQAAAKGLPLQIHGSRAGRPRDQRGGRRPRLADPNRASADQQAQRLATSALRQDAPARGIGDREAAIATDREGAAALRNQNANILDRGRSRLRPCRETDRHGRQCDSPPWPEPPASPHRRLKSENNRVNRMLIRMLLVSGK